jgi:hypothetical protein
LTCFTALRAFFLGVPKSAGECQGVRGCDLR